MIGKLQCNARSSTAEKGCFDVGVESKKEGEMLLMVGLS